MSSLDTLRLAQKRLNVLPERTKGFTLQRISPEAREVAEAYYRCSLEVAKVIYISIDRRYQDRTLKKHRFAMEDAKRILNDARNDVLEAVLPLFQVRRNRATIYAECDNPAAYDFIIQNVYNHMILTFQSYTEVFAEADEVGALSILIDKVAATQKVRLVAWLANYSFTSYTDDLKNRTE